MWQVKLREQKEMSTLTVPDVKIFTCFFHFFVQVAILSERLF